MPAGEKGKDRAVCLQESWLDPGLPSQSQGQGWKDQGASAVTLLLEMGTVPTPPPPGRPVTGWEPTWA